MKEVRPIRRREADEFLRLLCLVFDLDHGQAKSIFFTEPGFDLSRKWALFQDGDMISILTTSPLQFGWGRAIGIAGVATRHAWRGRGLAEELLAGVLDHSDRHGEGAAILFARDARLYRRLGFEVVDNVIRAEVATTGDELDDSVMPLADVQDCYNDWADEDPARLVRDRRKWDMWTWSMKHCERRPGGYVCVEPALLREAILPKGLSAWPVAPGSIFLGMEGVAQDIEAPLRNPRQDMLVMTRCFPFRPKMFMTDQF